MVIKRITCLLAQNHIEINSLICQSFKRIKNLLTSRFEHTFKTAQQCKRKDDLAKLYVLERSPKIFRIFPDEINQARVAVHHRHVFPRSRSAG